jgi:3-phenylpropionate/cinnamic acid dioxygenase small subunit
MAGQASYTGPSIGSLLLGREIEEFLYHEAMLLDERHFEEWLDLFTEDVCYWMPMRRNIKFGEWEREYTNEDEEMSWFDEDKVSLTQRVQQIMTGVHWAEEPISRVRHIVSNVQILKVKPNLDIPSEVTVKSYILVYRNRQETETTIFVGSREDVLCKVNGRWKIRRRKIALDQNVLLAKNLTIFF